MPTIPHTGFYVYTLAHSDGRVFYVGKGSRTRISDHESEARREHRCLKCAIIRAIWKSHGVVMRAKILETTDEALAYRHELALINRLRSEQSPGTLCNSWIGRAPARRYVRLGAYDRSVLDWFTERQQSILADRLAYPEPSEEAYKALGLL